MARIAHRLRPRALLVHGLRLLPFVVVPAALGGYLYSAVADGFQGERAVEDAKDYWRENLATWRTVGGRTYAVEFTDDLNHAPFAEIAQSHYIDTALDHAFHPDSPLAEAMPDDLGVFFLDMAAANARRNAALLKQLTEIAAAMQGAGITCVALKGAAELLAPWWDTPNGRYLSDLDLLVP